MIEKSGPKLNIAIGFAGSDSFSSVDNRPYVRLPETNEVLDNSITAIYNSSSAISGEDIPR